MTSQSQQSYATSPGDAPPDPATGSPKLVGTMTTVDIVFTVLAFSAPMSVFIGYLPVIIGYGNGLGAPALFIGAGALVLAFAVGFMAMTRHLPNPGAFYAYITAGLGRPLGLGSSFVAITSYLFLYVSGLVFGGLSFQALVRDVFAGPDVPWWVYTFGLVALVAVLGYFEITLSARILTVAMILEVIVIVIYDAVTLGSGGAEGFSLESFAPGNVFSGSIGIAVLYGILMFSGFEATAIFREEARNPEKTIPRATYTVIISVAVLYGISTLSLIIGVGPSTVVDAAGTDPAGLSLQSVALYLGVITQHIVIAMLCLSIFAANLATHNVTARYLYSLGVDGVLPRVLGKVHQTHRSPYVASIVTSAIAAVFLAILVVTGADGTTVYALLGGIAGYSLIMLLLITSVAIAAYFWPRRKAGLSTWRMLVAPLIATAGFAVALVLATQNAAFLVGGSEVAAAWLVAMFYVLLALGIAVALILRKVRPATYARIGRQEI
jgi:amino acid transporter